MAREEISHEGRIVSIDRYVTEVEIIRSSACSECHAKSLCGYSEQESKIVSVPTDAFSFYNVGDRVELCMKQSMGIKAVWISYVIPLIVLFIAMGAAHFAGCGELATGLCGIGAVVTYYIMVFIFRERLNDSFEFYIKQKYD